MVLSALFHTGLVLGSLIRHACNKNTSDQIKITLTNLAKQRQASSEKNSAFCL
ncbi:hypothetical protein CLAVI_000426 [Candidatus Clavichlamydia salmonicola]|uniref:hypothetical protein n=1 Tax=Candidatus Clavichlamydia salmonicola TaxID=469812 RepID=UPI001891CFCC|nr:hypothetical protein [Candidatus Clavichlamydia salmonicola]MBF5050807.1 hypothetical protein [Candidatus Clavichlamydia salmonicola]